MFFYFKKIESKICPPKVAKLLRLVPSKHVNSKKSPLLNDHLKNSENLYLFGVIQHLRGDNFAILDPPPGLRVDSFYTHIWTKTDNLNEIVGVLL